MNDTDTVRPADPGAQAPRRDTLLLLVIAGTALLGAVMVLAPEATRQGYGLMMFGHAARMSAWPAEARGYVTLLHGVLGAVMIGWAVALAALLRGPWAHAAPQAWRIVALSAGSWYVIDTAYSALVGAWPNVALNTVFALGFAAALSMARPRR